MREFDKAGSHLASFQAKLCEASLQEECSSPIFLRRLFKSRWIESLDNGDPDLLPLDVDRALRELNEEYGGPSSYGQIRYSKDELFWIGWFYRYIAYTRQVSTLLVYHYIKPDYLRDRYYVYHTQSEEWGFARILENLHLSEEDFDYNARLKRAMRNYYKKLGCILVDK